ncbi:ABC transporter ATP-binding protein [Candidatus Marinamargulisbacteria bacterium SCGC AAA071-K20]|nr:ABC transporter ATP-binding protein [Candidatus Marinamargulisbacteria bacterium SCGC AAA071-K20]
MITVNNLTLSFAGQDILNNITFNINQRDKIGLIGRNGSGKTTLFSLLTRELEPDTGLISIPKGYTIGIVKQHLVFTENTVLGEGCLGLRPDDEYSEWKVEKLLTGLGFTDEDMYRDPAEFSGGYQIRLNLVKCLAFEPDMLLLDEPTNYLDIASVRWLQNFLKTWPGELILISHDRHFMDSITNHTVAIHRKDIRKMRGSTLDMYNKIDEDEEIHEKTRLNQEKKDKKTLQFIDTYRAKANMAKLVQSRIKAMGRSETIDKLDDVQSLAFSFREADFHAKTYLKAKDLHFTYEGKEKEIIKGFSINIEKDDCVCIVGKNGIGKSTLLKLLYKALKPNAGEVTYHDATKIGFFGQTNISTLTPDYTIEEELQHTTGTGDREKVRKICGTMMFSGDLAKKKINVLSGGEKSRVLLGRILLTPSNLLMLDEPTHHLDMDSCDVLVQAIKQFKGASIIVTHNETFLHLLAKKLIVFSEKGIETFYGTYQEYLDQSKL